MGKKKVKKKSQTSKFEKLLYTFTVILVVASPMLIVFSKSTLAYVSFEVEQQKEVIQTQEKTNESLVMTINELASLTKIQEVAEDQGLSYNNSSIKTIIETE